MYMHIFQNLLTIEVYGDVNIKMQKILIALAIICCLVLSAGSVAANGDVKDITNSDISDVSIDSTDNVQNVVASDNKQSIVNNTTFKDYFDDTGALRSNVTANNLTFEGDFSNLGIDTISVDRQIYLNGTNANLINIGLTVNNANNVIIDGFTIQNQTISINNAINTTIVNNNIITNNVAINAVDVENLKINLNKIIATVPASSSALNGAIVVNKGSNISIQENEIAVNGNGLVIMILYIIL